MNAPTAGRKTTSLPLAAIPASVHLARSFTTRTLSEWEVPQFVVDDAVLIVSELVTNAMPTDLNIPICESKIGLYLTSHSDGYLLIEVTDSKQAAPKRRRPKPDSESGRGLSIINALSADWGHYFDSRVKTVWAKLDCTTSLNDEARSNDAPSTGTEWQGPAGQPEVWPRQGRAA